MGKPEGKRPIGRPWSRWKDNIKMDLQEVGCRSMVKVKVTFSLEQATKARGGVEV